MNGREAPRYTRDGWFLPRDRSYSAKRSRDRSIDPCRAAASKDLPTAEKSRADLDTPAPNLFPRREDNRPDDIVPPATRPANPKQTEGGSERGSPGRSPRPHPPRETSHSAPLPL